MARLPRALRRPLLPAGRGAARGAGRELSRVGRHRVAAAHRDRRLARGADLQRVRDPARRLHRARRPDRHLRSARSDSRAGRRRASATAGALRARPAHRPRSTAASSSTTSLARDGECRALLDAYERARRLRRELAALQDSAQEGVLRGADRRALRRACSPPSERGDHPPPRPVDARWSRTGTVARTARRSTSRRTCARTATASCIKPNDEYGGTGVTLGWETERGGVGRRRVARALARTRPRLDGAASGSRSGARRSRSARRGGVVDARHARRLRAVYLSAAGSPGS